MALKTVPVIDFRIQWLDLWHDYIHTVPQMFFHPVKHHGIGLHICSGRMTNGLRLPTRSLPQ
jgi:hypothetical protein